MNPEQEALRLSAWIALGVGIYLITLSVDNFNQKQLPTRIGQTECTWWTTNFGGCEPDIWTPQKIKLANNQ